MKSLAKFRILTTLVLAFLLAAETTFAALKPKGIDPFILIHGWGTVDTDFNHYVWFLEQAGVPKDRIHLVRYNYLDSIEGMRVATAGQILQIMQQYDSEQKFAVVGHSLGQFVGLNALVSTSLEKRIAKFVGLTGIAHGLDSFIGCNGPFLGIERECGGISELIPTGNLFLQAFYTKYKAPIAELKKCSIDSGNDFIIESNPASGRFEGGINVQVQAERLAFPLLHYQDDIHFKIKDEQPYFNVMKSYCFGTSWPPQS